MRIFVNIQDKRVDIAPQRGVKTRIESRFIVRRHTEPEHSGRITLVASFDRSNLSFLQPQQGQRVMNRCGSSVPPGSGDKSYPARTRAVIQKTLLRFRAHANLAEFKRHCGNSATELTLSLQIIYSDSDTCSAARAASVIDVWLNSAQPNPTAMIGKY